MKHQSNCFTADAVARRTSLQPPIFLPGRFCSALTVAASLVFASRPSSAEPPPAFAFSIGSNQIPGVIWPTSVGSDEAGRIYISSQANVIQVDTNGTVLNRWGSQGTGAGQFSYAGDLGFDGAGHIFVLDSYNNRVEEFDTNGTFITAWGSQGALPGQFDQPGGLAVSRSGRIYVSDWSNFRVQVFSSPGVFLEQFGSLGTNSGEFTFPTVIAADSSNNVYVVDAPGGSFDNYRIQKFDADGNFLLEWGPPGINTSGAIEVGGITTDKSNNVYVADASNNRIQKFTSNGVLLSEWGSSGSAGGMFNGAMDVAIDPSGNYVYVSDYYNERVDVFAYSPLAPLIYQPPTNQVVPAGVTVAVNAGVFGVQPLSFQWQFNGADMAGATGSVLLISNISVANSGAYTISASNAFGSAASPSAFIQVVPAVVTTLPVSGISATSAVLNGSVWVGDIPTTTWFEWGTKLYGNIGGVLSINKQTTESISLPLTNLEADVIYHYRVAASNALGVVYGDDMSFQVGLRPVVVTLPVVPNGSGTVLLNASVNPEARDTLAYFQWGKFALTQYTATNRLPPNAAPIIIQNQVTNLQPGAIYQARAVASNQLGLAMGATINFVAPPWVLLPAPAGIVWSSIAVSADATKLAAVASGNRVYVSNDSGMTWTNNEVGSGPWHLVSMSADGERLIVATGGSTSGTAYVSTNGAKSWFKANGPTRNWYALAGSGDGLRLAAVDATARRILTSTNGGLAWQTNSPPVLATWDAIASSADGLRLIVAAGGATNGPVYTSTNAGLSWTGAYALPVAFWRAVGSSADGQTLLAAVSGSKPGPIYISTNGGDSWSLTAAPITNWQSVAVSADGSKLAALARVSATPVFTSTNLGVNWQSAALPQALWSDLVLSADGSRLFASGDQNIFTLQTPPEPVLSMAMGTGKTSLSWVISSTAVVLQETPDLSAPQWMDSLLPVVEVLTNLRYQVTIPATNATGFYRLHAVP